MKTREGTSWERSVPRIRQVEFESAMALIPLGRDARVLKLGSSDGFQLGLLRRRLDRVVAIDPAHRPTSKQGFVFGVAEALPFPDAMFDLVISNRVEEHLRDRRKALEEKQRVLRPGGSMLHVVPGVFWKITALPLNPLGYPLRMAEKWRARRQVPQMPGNLGGRLAAPPRPEILEGLSRWVCPPLHGTYSSHLAECRAYRRRRWREIFTHSRLAFCAEAPLQTYAQFGFLSFHFLGLRGWLARRGAASSWAFLFRKVEQ